MRDLINMQWGILSNNQSRYERGVDGYLRALGQLRGDGSLPLETERGSRALWYQRHALATLTTMAEIAQTQGHDLYNRQVNGKTIHLAVRYLLRALDDPTLVHGYAAANYAPGSNRNFKSQDTGFLQFGGHGRHYMAWTEAYRRRFPNNANTRQIGVLMSGIRETNKPLIDEYSGGNASCFFR